MRDLLIYIIPNLLIVTSPLSFDLLVIMSLLVRTISGIAEPVREPVRELVRVLGRASWILPVSVDDLSMSIACGLRNRNIRDFLSKKKIKK